MRCLKQKILTAMFATLWFNVELKVQPLLQMSDSHSEAVGLLTQCGSCFLQVHVHFSESHQYMSANLKDKTAWASVVSAVKKLNF